MSKITELTFLEAYHLLDAATAVTVDSTYVLYPALDDEDAEFFLALVIDDERRLQFREKDNTPVKLLPDADGLMLTDRFGTPYEIRCLEVTKIKEAPSA